MKAQPLSQLLVSKQITLTLLILLAILVGASEESNAQLFRRSNPIAGRLTSNSFWTKQPAKASKVNSDRTPRPVTGYGANFHRNFVIRQQQQRSQAGGSLINRGNVLWRR